jgi:dienelactone hydrolase
MIVEEVVIPQGTLNGIDYKTLADDAIAGQSALAKLPRIDAKRIGFWGFSQGGWIAVLAASRSPSTAFAISGLCAISYSGTANGVRDNEPPHCPWLFSRKCETNARDAKGVD